MLAPFFTQQEEIQRFKLRQSPRTEKKRALKDHARALFRYAKAMRLAKPRKDRAQSFEAARERPATSRSALCPEPLSMAWARAYNQSYSFPTKKVSFFGNNTLVADE
jgi:hypothetical protein